MPSSPALRSRVQRDGRAPALHRNLRSFRNRHDAAIWKQMLRRAGLQLVFTEQGIISGDPRHKVVEGFNELADEISSDTQGMFISSGLRQKFEKGGVNGVPPLGYGRYHGLPGDPKNGSLIIDEQGRRIVRAIVELYLTGQHSAASIAMRLNAELDEHGQPLHRTRLGLPLTKGSVEEVLRNRVYTGVTVWRPATPDEEIRPGSHKPIITQDEWEAIERIRARRTTRRGRRPVGRVYPLSGPPDASSAAHRSPVTQEAGGESGACATPSQSVV